MTATFPGWRAVGRALRWARQQQIPRTLIRDETDQHLIELSWHRGGHLVSFCDTGGQIDLMVLPADGGDVRGDDLDGHQVVGLLAGLRLIPAWLAEVVTEVAE